VRATTWAVLCKPTATVLHQPLAAGTLTKVIADSRPNLGGMVTAEYAIETIAVNVPGVILKGDNRVRKHASLIVLAECGHAEPGRE
jgi:hypothetical protein